jgi:hypothetical protein
MTCVGRGVMCIVLARRWCCSCSSCPTAMCKPSDGLLWTGDVPLQKMLQKSDQQPSTSRLHQKTWSGCLSKFWQHGCALSTCSTSGVSTLATADASTSNNPKRIRKSGQETVHPRQLCDGMHTPHCQSALLSIHAIVDAGHTSCAGMSYHNLWCSGQLCPTPVEACSVGPHHVS